MLTKFQVKTKIKLEQEKLDNLIRELLAKKQSLQCDVVTNQAKKIESLKELLNSMEGGNDNGKM